MYDIYCIEKGEKSAVQLTSVGLTHTRPNYRVLPLNSSLYLTFIERVWSKKLGTLLGYTVAH